MYLEDGILSVLTLDPQWEEAIAAGMEQTERGILVSLDPRLLQKLFYEIGQALEVATMVYPIVLVSPTIRMALKRLTERAIPKLIVLSFNEIVPEIQVQAVGTVKWREG